MPKDSTKTVTRTGSLGRRLRGRRGDAAARVSWRERAVEWLTTPRLGSGLLVAVIFAAIVSQLLIWSRQEPLVAVGRIMDETRLVRVELKTEDRAQTQQLREAARQSTPRVYVGDTTVLDAITNSLEKLPRTLASAESLDAVDPKIIEQFGLSPEMLAAIKAEAIDGQPSQSWEAKVRELGRLMLRRPILERQAWQRAVQEGSHSTIKLIVGGRQLEPVFRGEVVNADDRDALAGAMNNIAREAGFTGPLRTLAVNRLTINPRRTFTLDESATAQDQNAAAAAIDPVFAVSPVGQIIYQRGSVLTQAQQDLFEAELNHYRNASEWWQRLTRNIGITGAVIGITLALVGYTILFCQRARSNASRMIGVASILLVTLLLAVFGTAAIPGLSAMTVVTPTVLVALLMTVAYDRRSALAYALLHGLLVAIALRQSVGTVVVMIAGVACVVWSLKEIRDRTTLVRTTVFTAIGVAIAKVLVSFIERPLVDGVVREVAIDTGLIAVGILLVGGMTLFLLPMLERAFNVTTGMTLIELRDPKQPLLRELQQRAPGTYNHSLNVAAIAETAAEAVGADALLTYVGALYHDVGKMNKPEYFVENQAGGPNKHDRLSPAMSLLVVVGHVKDGLELAREAGLPKSIQHFVEAHHGTTLVEYFYHRARQQALAGKDAGKDFTGKDGAGAAVAGRPKDGAPTDANEAFMPDEFEYRYPGPKPRTKEVAILMIADAVESATRAMSEPTSSRIDALVRQIANKRLMDGQFDDCDLTLKDLHTIVESVSRTVASMYHGRVAYPSSKGTQEKRA